MAEESYRIGTTKRKSDISGVRLKRSIFGLILVGRFKWNEKSVRMGESPTYPGQDVMGYNCRLLNAGCF